MDLLLGSIQGGDYPTFVKHLAVWETTLGADSGSSPPRWSRNMFVAWPPRGTSSFLLGLRATHTLRWPSATFSAIRHTHYAFYHITPCEMENGCGCYGRMETMSGSRRLKFLIISRPRLGVRDGGGAQGGPWSRVQVNKLRGPHWATLWLLNIEESVWTVEM